MANGKQKILIVDDSVMNRALLESMLEDQYEVVEAEHGGEAVALLQEDGAAAEYAVMLLDIQMPIMDGFGVLRYMNEAHLIEALPVIMISSETSPAFIEQAYDLGATDYISRPFDEAVVRRRIANTVLLNARQRRLTDIVVDQLREKRKSDQLMISILAHIVEFRNGESGMHVLHIHVFTRLLLTHLLTKTDRYPLTRDDINMICTASTLHDIGKLSVPDEVLNKPGRFTDEEFAIMKQHTTAGAEMLRALPYDPEEPLLKMSYAICRWHHERYDGRGYPDGLSGDDIPIAAQVVAMADVYDALTSERCYKKAFSHAQAMEMILGGQCGAFNPLLLDCLRDVGDELNRLIHSDQVQEDEAAAEYGHITQQLHNYGLHSTEQRMQEQDYAYRRYRFLMGTANEIYFSYTDQNSVMKLNPCAVRRMGLRSTVDHPLQSQEVIDSLGKDAAALIYAKVAEITSSEPEVHFDVHISGALLQGDFHCHCLTFWSGTDQKRIGLIAKLTELTSDHSAVTGSPAPELVPEDAAQPGGGDSMTRKEARSLIRHLRKMFDAVRLVNPERHLEIVINEDGTLEEAPFQCFFTWNRAEPCENCISRKCLTSHRRMSKFEFVESDVYHVHAVYLELEGQPCALELIDKISDQVVLMDASHQQMARTIADYRKEIYTDPLTGVQNRRYYEEHLNDFQDVNAVAMIDLDHFKQINDTCGHPVGDLALTRIAGVLRSCVRRSDVLVRFGGDEFVALFRSMPYRKFEEKLHEMSDAVRQTRLPDHPQLEFSVSIGGIYGENDIPDMVALADDLMYQAKRENSGSKIRFLTGSDMP